MKNPSEMADFVSLISPTSRQVREALTSNEQQVASGFEAGLRAVMDGSAPAALPTPAVDTGAPFHVYRFPLLQDSPGKVIGTLAAGYGIYFRRRGSVPGARLVVEVGGRFETLTPGDYLRAQFGSATVIMATNSAGPGTGGASGESDFGCAELVVFARSDSYFKESESEAFGTPLFPVNLVGGITYDGGAATFDFKTVTVGAFVAETELEFQAHGWRHLRIFLDGDEDGMTSCELVPMFSPEALGLIPAFFEQTDARISVPASISATDYRYRVIDVEIQPTLGRMCFWPISKTGGVSTEIGMIVQGVA